MSNSLKKNKAHVNSGFLAERKLWFVSLCVCGSFCPVYSLVKAFYSCRLVMLQQQNWKKRRQGKRGWLLKLDVPVLHSLFSGFKPIFNGGKVAVGLWRHFRVLGWTSGLWKVIQKQCSRVILYFCFVFLSFSCVSLSLNTFRHPCLVFGTQTRAH